MKIECISATGDHLEVAMGGTLIRNEPDPLQVRKGLTRVYVFKRNDALDLVADVENEKDIRKFLSIREGYLPYGDDVAVAEENYGWTEVVIPEVDPSQPEVVEEFFDDDDIENMASNDEDDDDDDDDFELGGLPEVPAEDADGDAWMAYGASLTGVDDPKDKKQLEAYAQSNYGEDINRSFGHLKLLKQIGAMQIKATAE